jgi:hypothetical protein
VATVAASAWDAGSSGFAVLAAGVSSSGFAVLATGEGFLGHAPRGGLATGGALVHATRSNEAHTGRLRRAIPRIMT